MQPGKT